MRPTTGLLFISQVTSGESRWNDTDRGTLDLSTRVLWQSYQRCHLVANLEELAKEMMTFALRSLLCYTTTVFLTCCKSYDMGPTALLPFLKMCCGYIYIYILKNPSPRPGLNPRTLGPMASMITIRPPRTLIHGVSIRQAKYDPGGIHCIPRVDTLHIELVTVLL
jgi:hypothetical protein